MGQGASSMEGGSSALTTGNSTQSAPTTVLPTDTQVFGAAAQNEQDKQTALMVIGAAVLLYFLSRR